MQQSREGKMDLSHGIEGILEIFQTPPEGYKEYCGHKIESNTFFHTVETVNTNINLDTMSIQSSHYSEYVEE